jgi:hypothetical protein
MTYRLCRNTGKLSSDRFAYGSTCLALPQLSELPEKDSNRLDDALVGIHLYAPNSF